MSTAKNINMYDVNRDISLINPVMRPEEVREGDNVKCHYTDKTGKQLAIRLWTYCPFGFEFIVNDKTEFHVEETGNFKLVIGKDTIDVSGSIVFITQHSEQEYLIGVRVNFDALLQTSENQDRRNNSRWNCPEHLLPSGTAPNPNRYNDFILFRVIDVSSKGLKIATSLRNKLLIVGQVLECTLSIPMIGTVYVGVKINRVGIELIAGKEQLILGCTMVRSDEVVLSTISEYLLTFAEDCSIKTLREAGFVGTISASSFDVSYSKSARDYDEVLDLRVEAYRDSGKLDESISREFMRDEFDARARILTTRVGGKLIASARAMFHEKNDKTSHERYLKYPENFPNISECLEVSRVCVSPDFQGAGLARELAKHLALLTIKAGKKYIFLSAAGTLIDFWQELGFKDTGVTYVHNQLGNTEHKLLVNNVQQTILGRGISKKNWLASYEHLYKYCVDYALIEPSTMDVIKNSSYVAIKKLFG